MRKKSGFTIVEQAIVLVPEFENVVRKLEQQVTLRGQSKSTLNNYIRRIALFVIHFGKLPEQIDPEEINEYLAALARDPRSPSRSSFKHMVYGLRYYYRLLGMNKNAIALPSLKKDTKLPVILNHQELKALFSAPTLLKQRIVLTLIYSAGLRGQEVINLKISDVDFERKTIHIRQSKYKKDRIVPLADVISRFGSGLIAQTRLSVRQLKVLGKITQCRTASLGGHEEVCENCGTIRYSYNSCGDRHCPKCQASKQAFWIDDLMQSTLPIKHYHMVFTLPHQLNVMRNHKLKFVPEEKPDIQVIIKKQKGPETKLERLERLTGVNPCLCPVCKTGRMIIVRELPRIRSPSLIYSKQPQPKS